MTDLLEPAPLVVELVNAFKNAEVSYCHWKSNESLDRAMAAEQDLDLLIARRDGVKVAEILHGLGFTVARPTRDRQLPGVVDYYAMDEEAGRIVHVHAHFVLVLGDDMTKNFHLPVEEQYLAGCSTDGPLPVPSPEWEYLVFVLRMVVKHSPWDAQLARKGKLSLSERRELGDLTGRADADVVDSLRRTHLPLIDDGLFAQCVDAVNGRMSRAQRMVVGRRLLVRLDSLGRTGPAVDLGLRVWRRSLRRFRNVTGWQASGKRLQAGGSIIAVVGSDGSGKSSAVAMLADHLSKDFALRRIHMGKPPWSRSSRLLRRPMVKARRFGMFQSTRLAPWTDFSDGSFPGYAYLLWHLLIARDRYLQYRDARRFAGSGGVVVSDRWPLQQLRMMDAARLQNIPAASRRPLAAALCRLEQRYYQAMLAPDLLVILRVDPEVAMTRRTEDPGDFVHRRASEVLEANWEGVQAVIIDANQELESVHRQIRSAVWHNL